MFVKIYWTEMLLFVSIYPNRNVNNPWVIIIWADGMLVTTVILVYS